MKQKVLKNNQEVYASLMEEIDNSKYEILAAVAFFTNQEILDKLIEKASQGVKVSIIVADVYKNNNLDFNSLTQYDSAEVIKKKMEGYSMMNQKFCIIDRKVVIQGSYNWTLNSNNEDSALNSKDKETVKSYVEMFFESIGKEWGLAKKNKGFKLFPWLTKREKPVENEQIPSPQENTIILQENDPIKNEINKKYDVDEILNSIITAELNAFDREELKKDGCESAKNVQGDANVLMKKMDTLYHTFINDKNKVEDPKTLLKDKIKNKIDELSTHITNLFQNKIGLENTIKLAKEKDFSKNKADVEGDIKLKKEKLKSIDETEISNLEKEIKAIENEIRELDPDLLKPVKKRYVFIPLVILAVILGIGLFLFYSSCSYILFYAEQDMLKAMRTTGRFNMGIFVANSLERSWNAGGFFAMIYSAIFCMIPYAIGFVFHDLKKWQKRGSWALIFIIDALIAINVSNTINTAGKTFGSDVKHSIIALDKLPEYIIILFLGLIPMVILVIVTKRIIKYYDDNHPEKGRLEKELKKKHLTENALVLDGEIFELSEQKDTLNQQIIGFLNEKRNIEIEELYLPKEFQERILRLEEQKKGEILYLEKKRDLYINAIDNNSIRVPANALKDRVNVFLEGWNEWLHKEYARELAKTRSEQAREVIDAWMDENLSNSELLLNNTLKLNS